MITKLLISVLLFLFASKANAADDDVTCSRDFRKVGCYKRSWVTTGDLLITDLDPTHKNYTTDMNWDDYAAGIHSLACRCREKAEGHYKYFAIGFHAECVAGKDYAALERMFTQQSEEDAQGCISGDFTTCDKNHKQECAGVADYDFFYEVITGSTCNFQFTPSNLDGKGNALYLDRHQVTCVNKPGGVVSMFHLERPDSTHVRYQYKCCNVPSYMGTCQMQEKTTKFDLDGAGSIHYLDRQVVDCGERGYIAKFQLQRSRPYGKIQYKYTCCVVNGPPTCYWADTPYSYDGKGNLVYLDRQTVRCGDGYALSYFHLRRQSNEKFVRYHYRCCATGGSQPVEAETCTLRYTPPNLDGKGNMLYLDRHDVNCRNKASDVVSMFHLQRPNPTHVRYQYKCCSVASSFGKCSSQTKATHYNLDGRGNLVYLDRHAVDCGENGYITNFKIVRSRPYGRIQYRYNCCVVDQSPSCYTHNTPFTYDGKGSVVYLDRQTVSCKDGYGLSYFHLRRHSNLKYVQYAYRCCKTQE